MDIESAISECKDYAEKQQNSASRILRLLLMIGMTIVMLVFMIFMFTIMPVETKMAASDSPIANTLIFGFLTVFSVILGILVSLYRFHLNEVARTEHYIIGFMRVKAAASIDSDVPKEVIQSLTDSAFAFIPVGRAGKQGKIENPVPGHPTLELSTLLMNKLVDSIELRPKKDKAEQGSGGNG